MTKTLMQAILAAVALAAAATAVAKLPPPPPPTDAQKHAAEEKKEKDKAAAEKAKEDLAEAQDRAVKSYRANMKHEGKPIAKPARATSDASKPPRP